MLTTIVFCHIYSLLVACCVILSNSAYFSHYSEKTSSSFGPFVALSVAAILVFGGHVPSIFFTCISLLLYKY